MKSTINMLFGRFRPARHLRVDIACPHGQFIPATYPVGDSGHRLSCDDCHFVVTLGWMP